MPSRDHRCGAFSPPAPLSPEKQARLCLTPAHTSCATYLASLGARTGAARRGPGPTGDPLGPRADDERHRGSRAAFGRASWQLVLDRRRWPAIPAVILVTTLFVLALSGFRAGVPAAPVATAARRPPRRPLQPPRVDAGADRADRTPADDAGSRPTPPRPRRPTAKPTKAPSTPKPTAFRTYRVKSGDTLSAIAGRFGTTVAAIVDLNKIRRTRAPSASARCC